MVYKNLLYRIIFSAILLVFYIISSINNYFLFVLAVIIYLTILLECIIFFKNYLYLIILYILISFFCFISYFLNFFDFYIFNICIFTIIIFDSFSYFTGLFYGKKYIFKKISPKKTLEGYLGGIFFTNTTFFFYFIFFLDIYSYISFIIFINSIIIFSALGDLLQSFFKRQNNIKNSSSFLPGHGGFFDRFDSFLTSIVFLLFYSI